MNDMSIRELEDELHTGEREVLDPRTLATIRRHGGRRRTARRALTAVGTAGVVAVVGLTLALGGVGSDERTKDDSVQVADPPPHELSPSRAAALSTRFPAQSRSPTGRWFCHRPTRRATTGWATRPTRRSSATPCRWTPRAIRASPCSPARSWPAWLYDGTLDYEQSQKDENGSYPVGSTGTGILVEVGGAELACVSSKNYACRAGRDDSDVRRRSSTSSGGWARTSSSPRVRAWRFSSTRTTAPGSRHARVRRSSRHRRRPGGVRDDFRAGRRGAGAHRSGRGRVDDVRTSAG